MCVYMIVSSLSANQTLLIEDSDNYELFSEESRAEFLFRLFKGFAVGGEICQYDDDIGVYFGITKTFYKDIVAVQKDADGKIIVVSHIYKVRCKVMIVNVVIGYRDG